MKLLKRIMTPSDLRACLGMVGILSAIAAGMGSYGCDPCERASVVISQGEDLLPDAQLRLTQAAAIIAAMPASKAKDRAIAAIDDASESLEAARETLKLARTSCASPDLASIFAAFARAWELLRPFVGGTGAAVGYVPDPEAYSVGRQ
jgi:hypothetical protein